MGRSCRCLSMVRLTLGRRLFDVIERVVYRLFDGPSQDDLDLLWYLWSGPHSPLFGKDRITTLERDLVADKRAHHETKNPYFHLIHEQWFCEKILSEFGCDSEEGLIVNGHVPVAVAKGESPLKKSGKAITIDGAFSEAYATMASLSCLNRTERSSQNITISNPSTPRSTTERTSFRALRLSVNGTSQNVWRTASAAHACGMRSRNWSNSSKPIATTTFHNTLPPNRTFRPSY
jgi:hypothetical protein